MVIAQTFCCQGKVAQPLEKKAVLAYAPAWEAGEMRIIAAPQEFKGTLSAREAAKAMTEGARRAVGDATIEPTPLSDGGPGLVDAILASAGGRPRRALVQDPLGRVIEAPWALLDDGTAVIESAAAAGLNLLAQDERDPRAATTYGVGQLILAVLDEGCERIIVGLGGSATNDGGAGMAAALGARLVDASGEILKPGGVALAQLDHIDVSGLDPRMGQARLAAAADVTNPLCGPEGASLVYGPQKGASPEVARELDAALRHYADIVERDLGVSVLISPGAGAAGGLGAGLIAFARAKMQPGFEVVAAAMGLRERIRGADLLLTGEGRLDGQTSYGKTVAGIARMAAESGVPILVVPGALAPGWEAILPYVDGVEPVVGSAATEKEALARPAAMLALAVERALRGWMNAKAGE
jgi:glycerate 2-kinase